MKTQTINNNDKSSKNILTKMKITACVFTSECRVIQNQRWGKTSVSVFMIIV